MRHCDTVSYGNVWAGVTRAVQKRYTSVQCGAEAHLELNSDLVFINHSCAPNVAMDVDAMEVWALEDVPHGAELSFFYPSTEWEMEQPFHCWCRASQVSCTLLHYLHSVEVY